MAIMFELKFRQKGLRWVIATVHGFDVILQQHIGNDISLFENTRLSEVQTSVNFNTHSSRLNASHTLIQHSTLYSPIIAYSSGCSVGESFNYILCQQQKEGGWICICCSPDSLAPCVPSPPLNFRAFWSSCCLSQHQDKVKKKDHRHHCRTNTVAYSVCSLL